MESATIREDAAVRESATIREDAAVRESATIREDAAVRESATIREDAAVRESATIREDAATKKTVTIIGGGPAGMMAAIAAAREGAEVTLLEKNEKLGKKLYITGKGRCNLTNACDISEYQNNILRGGKFLYSALYSFTNEDTVRFFEAAGLPLKEERGKRIFPVSDHSSDVIKTLAAEMKRLGVRVKLGREVKSLDDFPGPVVVATGGLSYPSTGSTGDGYRWASGLGHKIVETRPSLVPFVVAESYVKELEGLSLRNVAIRLEQLQGDKKTDKGQQLAGDNNIRLDKFQQGREMSESQQLAGDNMAHAYKIGRTITSDFGEMLFTARGVSGPVILTASADASRLEPPFRLTIDLKPALDEKQLDARILRDFEENKNKNFNNSLGKLLPAKMIPVIVRLSGIDGFKKVNEVTRQERAGLMKLLKNMEFTVVGNEGYNAAVVTSGGVDVKGINPQTMESKLRPGLFFAGEVLDIDAYTGGFNIQLALSTGWAAGVAAARAALEE